MRDTCWFPVAALVWTLVGCGGTQTPVPTPIAGALAVVHAAGGPVLDRCIDDAGQMYLLFPFTLERWQLGERPELVERRTLAGRAGALGCLDGDDGGPPVDRNRKVTVDAKRTAKYADLEMQSAPGGWQIVGPDGPVLARPTIGRVLATAFADRALWASDGKALWRWVPGRSQPMRIQLPDALVDQPAVSLFFEGPVLWVRVAPDQGHPLDVDGPIATYVKPAGTLGPMATGPLLLPVSGTFVQLEIGQANGRIGEGPWTLPAPMAVMPWAGGLVVADAEGLTWWAFEGGVARSVSTLELPGTTALYDAGDHLVAVGGYGFVAIRRSSAPPRTQPSAP